MTVTNGAGYQEQRSEGMSMDGMAEHAQGPSHARKATSPRDHLWVLIVIAGFALYDVWTAWSQLGGKSGFGRAGWTLTVIVEVYLLYALFAWLGGAAGPRSRRFAMWSAGFVFILSLIGQASSRLNAHQVPPVAVVVFVSVLPVVGLMLIAFLIHFRQIDRAEAAEIEQERQQAERQSAQASAEVARIAELETALDTLRGELEAAQAEREAAEMGTSRALQEVEVLTRKLARISGRKPARKPAPKTASASAPNTGDSSTLETEIPDDVDTQAAALEILASEPGISGSALGRRLGMSERYGCMLKKQLAGSAPGGGSSS